MTTSVLTRSKRPEPAAGQPLRQHLIDPEVCIRCNACEETCPRQAVSHNDDNYVVEATLCENCGDCLDPCPTGAIHSWRIVDRAYSVEEQFSWQALPAQDEALLTEDSPAPEPAAAKAKAPASAPQVVTGTFTRARPLSAVLIANHRLTQPGAENDIRELVFTVPSGSERFVEGQSLGVVVPGTDAEGRLHAPRSYSLAGLTAAAGGLASAFRICVKRESAGLCSNFLCDLQPGSVVEITGPFGSTFLPPGDPAAVLMMVAAGTGIAPFRGFVARGLGHFARKPLLYYGGRSPGEMAYHDELTAPGPLELEVHIAYSRHAPEPRRHAQDALAQAADDVLPALLAGSAHLYLCGPKGLEAGVDERLADLLAGCGQPWPTIKAQMRAEGRFQVEVF